MKAQELMTPDPEVMSPGDPVEDAARRMRDLGVGAMLVVEEAGSRRLVGLVTDRDLVVRHLANGCGGCAVGDHMSTGQMIVTGPDADVRDLARRMREARVRRIPVVDDDGALVGIVARSDLLTEVGSERTGEVDGLLQEVSDSARPGR